MKNTTVFTMIVLFSIVLVVSGCGKLNQEEFEMWKNEHVSAVEQANSDMSNKITMLDGKVDQQKADLTESISKAKDEAIAASQQGDADSIAAAMQNAKEQDAQLRVDLTKAIDMQGEKAMAFTKAEDAKLQKQHMELEKADKALQDEIKMIRSQLMAAEEAISEVQMQVAAKPRMLVTVNFASGHTRLSSEAKEMLDGIIEELTANADAKIIVVGHADGSPVLRGTYRSNWDLSQARANSAAKYLKDKGIDADRIEAIGKAHTDPVAPQNTSTGRAMNRRVEVILLPEGAIM